MANLHPIVTQSVPARGNVIFVHGLGGHPFKTFQSDESDAASLWPTWIGQEVAGANIYSMGYQAPPTNYTGQALDLKQRAQTFQLALQNVLGGSGEPIVFVCHSLGGLIIKRLLRLLNETQDFDPESRKLLKRIRGIVFLATPHQGSPVATWAGRLGFFVNRSRAVVEMTEHDPALDDLNSWFRDWDDRPKCLIFYETVGLSLLGRVVPKHTGDPGLKQVTAYPVQKDHAQIAKPRERDDMVHQSVVSFLEKRGVLAKASANDYPKPSIVTNLQELPWQALPVIPRLLRAIPLILLVFVPIIFLWPVGSSTYYQWKCGADLGAERFAKAVRDDDAAAVSAAVCRPKYLDHPLAGTNAAPIIIATANGLRNSATKLIDGGAYLDARAKVTNLPVSLCPEGGTTALMVAAALDDVYIAQRLLDAGANEALADMCQDTAVLIAARNDAVQVFDVLNGIDSSALQTDFSLVSAAWAQGIPDSAVVRLITALEGDSPNVVASILSDGDFSSWRDENGNTIAHLAIDNGARNSLSHILDKLPGLLDTSNYAGNQPLHTALILERTARAVDLIRVDLIRRGADVRSSNSDGKSAWDLLVDEGPGPALDEVREREQLTTYRLTEMILAGEPLGAIQAHFDLEMPELNRFGREFDHWDFHTYDDRYLHSTVRDVFWSRSQKGITPLQAAIVRGSSQITTWLLGQGSDPTHQSQNEISNVRLAVVAAAWPFEKRRDFGIGAAAVLEAIYGGQEAPDDQFRYNTYFPPVLIDAAWSEALVIQLLAIGADPEDEHSDSSPLSAAASYPSNTGVVRALIEAGATKASGGSDVLVAAVAQRDHDLIDYMAEKLGTVREVGDINLRIGDTKVQYRGSALGMAVCIGDSALVDKLLGFDASGFANLFSNSALVMASSFGDIDIAESIVERTQIRESNRDYPRAIQAACTGEMLEMLCQHQEIDGARQLCSSMSTDQLPSTCDLTTALNEFSCLALR